MASRRHGRKNPKFTLILLPFITINYILTTLKKGGKNHKKVTPSFLEGVTLAKKRPKTCRHRAKNTKRDAQ